MDGGVAGSQPGSPGALGWFAGRPAADGRRVAAM